MDKKLIMKEAHRQGCSEKDKRDRVGSISGGYDLKEAGEKQKDKQYKVI